jgi:hypothetical protein
MWKKCVIGGLFVAVCLAVLIAKAPSQDGTFTNPVRREIDVNRKKEETKRDSDPSQRTVEPTRPESLTNLLNLLRTLKQQRAAIDKREQQIVQEIKIGLANQRERLREAEKGLRGVEDELQEIVPHLVQKQDQPQRAGFSNPQFATPREDKK